MMKDKKFLIVGLGLLGGSIALGLKKWNHEIYAIDIDSKAIAYGLEHHIIDEGSCENDPKLIQKADVIISGLYPTTFINWISDYQHLFHPNTLISDVTGVKGAIVYKIQSFLREDCEFIPAHPMAGKEVSGVQFADPSIFLPANLIITPTHQNTQEAIDFMIEFGKELRFNHICQLTVEEHDEMIGYLSQLTHVIAVSLMNANDSTHLKEYTGDSFRDLTRIAKINENLWTELFLLNKENLIKEIECFVNEVNDFKDALEKEDINKMKQKFITSTQRRKYFDL